MTSTDAFLLLQSFRRHVMPGLLRKLHLWKGLDYTQHTDLIDDLHQDLWLDCLQHPDLIVALPARERHTRWFRLLEKSHYRMHLRSERLRALDILLDGLEARGTPPPTDDEPGAVLKSADDPGTRRPFDHPDAATDRRVRRFDPVRAWGRDLPAPQQRFLRRVSRSASYLKNGRINCRVSARALGMRPHDLNKAWGEIAAELGFDAEFLRFWRTRLVEALVGLAADLLRDAGAVAVHGEERRRRPDPKGRLLRIRRLRAQVSCRPIPRDVKRVLTRYHGRRSARDLCPRRVLEDAAELLPTDPGIHLWAFEAHLAAGDCVGAAHAVRTARACGAERVPILLARARLLEVRGRESAAYRLLTRRRTAAPRDNRLQSALRRLAS